MALPSPRPHSCPPFSAACRPPCARSQKCARRFPVPAHVPHSPPAPPPSRSAERAVRARSTHTVLWSLMTTVNANGNATMSQRRVCNTTGDTLPLESSGRCRHIYFNRVSPPVCFAPVPPPKHFSSLRLSHTTSVHFTCVRLLPSAPPPYHLRLPRLRLPCSVCSASVCSFFVCSFLHLL